MKEIKLSDDAKVSVIVPVFAADKHLIPALNSLVMQNMRDIEIIVVDASENGEPRPLVDKFSFDRRLRYVRTDARTFGEALNAGHRQAKGEYITRCNSRSIYYANFIEALSQSLDAAQTQEANIELIYSDFVLLNEEGKVVQEVLHQSPQNKADLAAGYDIGVSLMYTRSLWEKTGEYWDRPCEDYNWAVRAAQVTDFGLIKTVLVAHRPQVNRDVHAVEVAVNDCKTLAIALAA